MSQFIHKVNKKLNCKSKSKKRNHLKMFFYINSLVKKTFYRICENSQFISVAKNSILQICEKF